MNSDDWKNDSINCEIAVRLSIIGETKGESAYRDKSSPNVFTYMGRKMGVGLKVVGCEVGDIPDEDDYVYTVYLGDFAICEDLRTVLQDMQKEKRLNIEILDYISISDCATLLGWDDNMPTPEKMVDDSGTKFKYGTLQFIEDEAKKFSMTGLAFYSIVAFNKFYLEASNQYLKDMIINKDEKFYYEMRRVKHRLTEVLPIELQEHVEKMKENAAEAKKAAENGEKENGEKRKRKWRKRK